MARRYARITSSLNSSGIAVVSRKHGSSVAIHARREESIKRLGRGLLNKKPCCIQDALRNTRCFPLTSDCSDWRSPFEKLVAACEPIRDVAVRIAGRAYD